MSSYCVIGSGSSGATIANLLSKKNSVHIYDKAHGPVGRSSFKRLAIVAPEIPEPITQ